MERRAEEESGDGYSRSGLRTHGRRAAFWRLNLDGARLSPPTALPSTFYYFSFLPLLSSLLSTLSFLAQRPSPTARKASPSTLPEGG